MFGKKRKQQPGHTPEIIDAGNLTAVVLSDLGNIRMNNEDLGLFLRMADESLLRERGCLLVVADGMGGHQAGEVASKMASEIISREYFRRDNNNNNIEKRLQQAFLEANKQIYNMAASHKAYQGMGTTCTALVIVDHTIYYAHVGDSRAYIIRKNSITQITEDHTYVQELLKKGDLTAEEAKAHPEKNILTNAMGTKPELRVDTGKCSFSFERHDRVLLCSDGLYDYLGDREMAEILCNRTLREAAALMVQEAKKRGGHDNITVAIAEKKEAAKETAAKETRDVVLPATKEYDIP